MSDATRQLCFNVLSAQGVFGSWVRWDESFVREWAHGQRWAFWERMYLEGRVGLEEFERNLGPLE